MDEHRTPAQETVHAHVARAAPYLPLALVLILAGAALVVWRAVLADETSGVLSVAFLDVGQGDAIFIETPNGTQVLIDGGKGREVQRILDTFMSFSDRTLDVVVATHPDLDHIGGLPDVFARYDVGMFIESGVADDGADNVALHDAVRAEGLEPTIITHRQQLMLDTGVSLDILFPDRDARSFEANTGSVVVRLTYGDTSFLLMGDTPIPIEEHLVATYGDVLASDVVKLGHHGSKTSSGEFLLGTADPEYAIISVGCDNTYGHPHADVTERLARFGIKAVSTCEEGTVLFESDGTDVIRKRS